VPGKKRGFKLVEIFHFVHGFSFGGILAGVRGIFSG